MGVRMERNKKRRQRQKESVKFFLDIINLIIAVIKLIKELYQLSNH